MLSDTQIRDAMVDYRDDWYESKIVEMFALTSEIDVETSLAPKLAISPFKEENLGPASYDVSIGQFYYTPNTSYKQVYCITVQDAITDFWSGPRTASTGMILVPANETILCHTEEFVSLGAEIGAQLHARSSIGRSGLSVCKCAGFIDPGYSGRITMEVSNHTKSDILIPVGLRVAQLVFSYVDAVSNPYKGKYGNSKTTTPEEWSPTDMLSKLYEDAKT